MWVFSLHWCHLSVYISLMMLIPDICHIHCAYIMCILCVFVFTLWAFIVCIILCVILYVYIGRVMRCIRLCVYMELRRCLMVPSTLMRWGWPPQKLQKCHRNFDRLGLSSRFLLLSIYLSLPTLFTWERRKYVMVPYGPINVDEVRMTTAVMSLQLWSIGICLIAIINIPIFDKDFVIKRR